MAISTTAGAGLRSCIKTLKKRPRWWCAKRTYGFGMAVRASRWEDVPDKTRNKATAKLVEKAKGFNRSIVKKDNLKHGLFIRIMFRLMGRMIGGYKPGSVLDKDKEYWKQKGWFNRAKPF